MAYAYNPDLSAEENERLRQQEEGGGAGIGQSGATIIGAAGAGMNTAQVQGSGGSGFTNLQTYLQANQAQAGELADMIKGNIEKRAGEAEGAVQAAGREGESIINAARVNADTGLMDRAFAAPENFVQNPTDLQSFLRMRDASYTGPAGLEEAGLYEPARQKVEESSRDVERLGTEPGRLELIRQIMQTPGSGKVALNQLLLQGTPEAAQKLTDLQGRVQNIAPALEDVRTRTRQAAEQARAVTDQTRQTTRARIGEEIPRFTTGIRDRVTSAEQQRQARNEALVKMMQDLEQGSTFLTPGAPGGKQLGYTPEQYSEFFGGGSPDDMKKAMDAYNAWELLYDLNMTNVDGTPFYTGPGKQKTPPSAFNLQPKNFVSQTNLHATPATQSNVATPEDFARARALEQLAGQDIGVLPESERGLAGTFNPKEGGVNFKHQEAVAAYQDRVRQVGEGFFKYYNRMDDAAKRVYANQAQMYAAMMRQAGLPEPAYSLPPGEGRPPFRV